jgi:c-di-GMP-binding flagellar brake protein YcgR
VSSAGSDRREFHRVRARPLISCLTVDDAGNPRLLKVRPADLSAGGISVVTDTYLNLNQKMRLSIQVGDPPETLKLDATVRRIEPLQGGQYVCGLAFHDLDSDRERRLVQAVFAHEQENVARHRHARMTVWESVSFTLPGGEEASGRALALSADDLRIVTRARIARGDRIRFSMTVSDLALALEAEAVATEVEVDTLGVRSCTLEFDALDRVTRSTILRHVMEQERRDLSR